MKKLEQIIVDLATEFLAAKSQRFETKTRLKTVSGVLLYLNFFFEIRAKHIENRNGRKQFLYLITLMMSFTKIMIFV